MRMKQAKAPKAAGDRRLRLARDASALGAACAPLLVDFPDPVLIADHHRRVVFLNRAAEKIFGDTLRLGDPCPICSQLTGLPLRADDQVAPGMLSQAWREPAAGPPPVKGGLGQHHPPHGYRHPHQRLQE